MSGKSDFLQLWRKACSGTSFAQGDVCDLLRKHAISTLVKQPPGRSAMETADRIRAMIRRNQADQQQTADNPTGSHANTLAGIAIVSNTTPVSEGQWVYSTDNGKTWLPVGSVSDSNALVLSRDIKLSFSPSANFNGQPAPLGERLIDSSATQVFGTTTGAIIAQGGIVQQGVDVTSNSGTTAVSAGQSSLGVTVASVNDAPVASADQASLPASIEHGPVVSESVLTLFGNNFDDTADQQQSEANPAGSTANILAGIAITGNTTPSSEGAWRYSIDGGKTWVAVGTVSPHSALVLNANALLTFTPAPNYNGIPMPLSAHLEGSKNPFGLGLLV